MVMGLTREEKAAQKAANDAAWEAERARKAFEESPAGRARSAFEQGDGFFEIELDMRSTGSLNSHGGSGVDIRRGVGESRSRRMDALSQIEGEGWSFVQSSYVFVQTGEDSRDKFMASGQRTAIKGKIVGVYLFRRVEQTATRVTD
jgi:hypothetical protein